MGGSMRRNCYVRRDLLPTRRDCNLTHTSGLQTLFSFFHNLTPLFDNLSVQMKFLNTKISFMAMDFDFVLK